MSILNRIGRVRIALDRRISLATWAIVPLLLCASPAHAQTQTDTVAVPVYRLDALEVTATRTSREVFLTPAAVSVVGPSQLRAAHPTGIADALRTLPGLDVTGVGMQQPRPVIRGLRGQRILLLQDGVRLNNTRRQQDFGEVPSLVDLGQVERIEVVRGPSSVLYGSDAIGGVINVITARPAPSQFGGGLSYEYSSAFAGSTLRGRLGGGSARVSVEAGGHWRSGDAYSAPGGAFGSIALPGATEVLGTGIEDWSAGGRLFAELAPGHDLSLMVEAYRADDAGFGLVEPSLYAPEVPRIDISYPTQRFERFTIGYDGVLEAGVADRVSVRAHTQGNQRDLVFDFVQGFGPTAPPGASIGIVNRNSTDLNTLGLRVEAKKLAGPVLFTYGVDGFRDDSENTDLSITTVTGFGPPTVEESSRPRVPNATYRSLGAFLQAERSLGRLTLIGGARVQSARAEAQETAGLAGAGVEQSATAAVGALNALFAVSPSWSLIGSVGRGFRAPNLVEWFFEGPVPEARAFQTRNPNLDPETSLSFDVGTRYRKGAIAAELFVFQNTIRNGIRSEATGDTIQGLAVFEALNLDELRYRGAEVSAVANLEGGFSLDGSYSHLSSEDVVRPENPTGESFANRWTGAVRWDEREDRFWVTWGVRHNGEQKEVSLANNPLGEVLPAFTVHHVRAGVRPSSFNGLGTGISIGVENLGDALYAEFANASFFRPEPGRRVVLRAEVSF